VTWNVGDEFLIVGADEELREYGLSPHLKHSVQYADSVEIDTMTIHFRCNKGDFWWVKMEHVLPPHLFNSPLMKALR
jgi:hypothetical protein